jgi:integrase/recombinase XerC
MAISERYEGMLESPQRITMAKKRSKNTEKEASEGPPAMEPKNEPESEPSETLPAVARAVPLTPLLHDLSPWTPEDFFRRLDPETRRGYRLDLRHLCRWLGAPDDVDGLARSLAQLQQVQANLIASRWRDLLKESGLAAATVNRRLAALRSLSRDMRRGGLTPWSIEVDDLKAKPYRDTRGPGLEAVAAMLAEARKESPAKGARDELVISFLGEMALRCKEVATLDLEHVSEDRSEIMVLRKKQSDRVRIPLPDATKAALVAWLAHRGLDEGPLVTPLDPGLAKRGRRGNVARSTIYRIVRTLAARSNVKAWPHGLRHTAITEALEQTGGNVRLVQRFSGHSKIETVMIYDDARKDPAKDVAELVSKSVREKRESLMKEAATFKPSTGKRASVEPEGEHPREDVSKG